jgi:hypothetical protein
LLPVASGGPTLNEQSEVEVHWIPHIINRIATYRSALFLLEKVDYAIDGKMDKQLEVITKRLNNVETVWSQRISVRLSSDYDNYESTYGVNRGKVPQDFTRNNYIASYGWN